jgi:hypothetical protein
MPSTICRPPRLAGDDVALIDPNVDALAFKISSDLKRELGVLAGVTDKYFRGHRDLLTEKRYQVKVMT